MNRRESIVLGLAAAMASGAGRAAETLLVGHVIRLGFAAGVSAEVRAAHIRTFNRFKQTKGPKLVVVGRDVSADGGFEFAQVTTFADEAGYRQYFYDPIHLAADREAETLKAVSRGASFDVFPRYVPSEAERVRAINTDRAARFKANDDRPTSPPVPDRPQDQRWPFGRTFFYIARFGFTADATQSDVAQFDALVHQAGRRIVISGRETGAPTPGQVGYALVARFAGEGDWQGFAGSPAMRNARQKGLLAAGRQQAFFVIDPADDPLAQRLRAALTG